MKNTKKLTAFLLSFALLLSSVYVQPAKAANEETKTEVTVSLRLETDSDTVVTPAKVTMTTDDLQNDFGIGLATGAAATYSPVRAFAKYLATEKQVTNEDMSKYIIMSPSALGGYFVTSLCTSGDAIGAAGIDSQVYWMYRVNGNYESATIDMYDCKDQDEVEIYGSYYHMIDYTTYEAIQSTYTAFDQKEYETTVGKAATIALNGKEFAGYDDNYASIYKDIKVEGATILVSKATSATAANAVQTVVTDKDGKAELTFGEEGVYTLSAQKLTEDGHNLLTRPYAVVKVAAKSAPTTEPTKNPTVTNTPQPTKNPSVSAKPIVTKTPSANKVKKPAAVKKLTAKVAKSKKATKKVTLTWKKAANAKGYQVVVSKKNKKHFKKVKTVKKNKAVLKWKKGTYYVKVRAYNKSGKTTKTGKYSKTIKVVIK